MTQLRPVHLDTATAGTSVATALASQAALPMRAILHRQYGTPAALELGELERPVPGDEEVVVRVLAAGVNIGDHHVVTGTPYVVRLSPHAGLRRPHSPVPGMALAGRVVAVGAKVTTFRPGDAVYGHAPAGAFAEYAAVPAERLAPRPATLSFEEAAATASALTALQGLRDVGAVQAGQKVLINGASGAVGSWAVQLAKAFGAEVTAVCSGRNADMVRALGADHVIDYAKEDFVTSGARFDLVFDTVGNRALAEVRRVLNPTGTYVACTGGNSSWRWLLRLAKVSLVSMFTRQKLKMFIVSPNRADLLSLKEIVEAGKAKPVIERRYALSEVADALRHVGGGHARGQVVIRVAGE